MTHHPPLRLLEGVGIESEYMIVRKDTLDILPVTDEVIRRASGKYSCDFEQGNMGWSNEFVLHVMELKNVRPVPSLKGLAGALHGEVRAINRILKPLGGLLMPSGMHPWMNPRKETRLWPHRYRSIYEMYDRIFNCRRHGWANLQSIHINISFSGDEEFGRLHAAIRLILPLIPALAASTPVADGRITGFRDTRLSHYITNQRKVPSVMGRVIPEPVFTEAGYRDRILKKMYADMEQHDPEGTVRHEWLNSRGAIPRFQRSAMEIRLVDTQECPAANIAVASLIVGVIKQLVSEKWGLLGDQKAWGVAPLLALFRGTIRGGEDFVIDDSRYLKTFGFPGTKTSAGELWSHLFEESVRGRLIDPAALKVIRFILERGTLSSRILASLGKDSSRERLSRVYGQLCRCLARNTLFAGVT